MPETLTTTMTEPPIDVNATHALKTWPQFYAVLEKGVKNFEVRRNDRDFSECDILQLNEYEPSGFGETEGYTGRALLRRVTYVLYGGKFGVEPGYVVLGLEPVEWEVWQ